MKKSLLTIAILLGLSLGAFAQGGLFGFGSTRESESYSSRENNGSLMNLPDTHGDTNDHAAPLGSGALLLIAFGAAYALKRRKK